MEICDSNIMLNIYAIVYTYRKFCYGYRKVHRHGRIRVLEVHIDGNILWSDHRQCYRLPRIIDVIASPFDPLSLSLLVVLLLPFPRTRIMVFRSIVRPWGRRSRLNWKYVIRQYVKSGFPISSSLWIPYKSVTLCNVEFFQKGDVIRTWNLLPTVIRRGTDFKTSRKIAYNPCQKIIVSSRTMEYSELIWDRRTSVSRFSDITSAKYNNWIARVRLPAANVTRGLFNLPRAYITVLHRRGKISWNVILHLDTRTCVWTRFWNNYCAWRVLYERARRRLAKG